MKRTKMTERRLERWLDVIAARWKEGMRAHIERNKNMNGKKSTRSSYKKGVSYGY